MKWLLVLLMVGCAQNVKRPKNIILVIGDGMGPQQLSVLYHSNQIHKEKSAFDDLHDKGQLNLVMTNAHNVLVADSASSATQMSIGYPSGSEMIGMDFEGKKRQTVLELAKENGMSTGLITDTRITHATPASFGAHVLHRSQENDIADQLSKAGIDLLLGGGYRHFLPQSVNTKKGESFNRWKGLVGKMKSKRKDERDLLHEMQNRGYTLAFNNQDWKNVKKTPVLGLFKDSALPDALSQDANVPSLESLSTKALDLLAKNEKGLFLMVESGQIDWAAHSNDAGQMLSEMKRIDRTLQGILKWAEKRGDTLVLVTADHETGSFGLSYSNENVPGAKKLSGDQIHKPNYNFGSKNEIFKLESHKKSLYGILREFGKGPKTPQRLQKLVSKYLPYKITLKEAKKVLARVKNPNYDPKKKSPATKPLISDFQEFYVYGDNDQAALLARVLAKKHNVVWGTGTHTATPVMLWAIGPGQEKFTGIRHHVEFGRKLQELIKEIK